MNKQKLRFISIGFLLSAVLLAGFQLFYPEALPGSTFNGEANADSTDYQEKYESTLAELELQKQLNEAATSSTPADGAAAASSVPTEAASVTDSATTPVANAPVTFVITSGQPMSVVIDNLVSAGLITDRAVFEQYLTDRNLVTKINVGEYQLTPDMGYEVIADIITLE
ncbi:hypothetical protein SDC9_119041 [bioreactor metagenome]|uniref:Aminodeoxychorismate lyase n=2 Tax=root TaxID=1 RepID=A0A1W1ICH4_9LACT|nr:hypothetical protein [Trichococcus pasteurii]SFE41133.1 hypothetical protein SAMN04488086_103184 [Trichococcus pasteurii]SLM50724.1 Hypothetical protein TPAS_396 [Trichococcus pasteurii]SSB91605.1 Hypothetical protein TPAS_396 [Trichococcus pasteurii]